MDLVFKFLKNKETLCTRVISGEKSIVCPRVGERVFSEKEGFEYSGSVTSIEHCIDREPQETWIIIESDHY